MTRNKLYVIIVAACLCGFTWIAWHLYGLRSDVVQPICVFHKITTIPCPACGTTRATILLAHGHIGGALLLNPLSIVTSVIGVLSPLWILFDLALGSDSLFRSYQWMERRLKQKKFAIPLIALVFCIWIRNIVIALCSILLG